jgi:hypothetical protein
MHARDGADAAFHQLRRKLFDDVVRGGWNLAKHIDAFDGDEREAK